jgi:hypothetical protein
MYPDERKEYVDRKEAEGNLPMHGRLTTPSNSQPEREKLELHVKGCVIVAQQTAMPQHLIVQDIMAWIDEYVTARYVSNDAVREIVGKYEEDGFDTDWSLIDQPARGRNKLRRQILLDLGLDKPKDTTHAK